MPKCKCGKSACFGTPGGVPNNCSDHSQPGEIDLKHKKCIFEGCNTRPNYGKPGKDAIHCAKHKKIGEIDVMNKKCIFTGCKTGSSYGKPEGTPIHCAKHKELGEIDLKHKKCIAPGCRKIPCYGQPGGTRKDAIHCKKHVISGEVDLTHPKCIFSGCQTRPSYGKPGGSRKDAVHCKEHSNTEEVDLVSRKCIVSGCRIQPSYGKPGGTVKNAIHCTKHKELGEVDLANRKCIFPSCSIIPCYGKPEGTRKDVVHCKKHKEAGEVDLAHPKCIFEGCITRPSYNLLGFSPEYCVQHCTENMVIYPLKKCSECKEKATHFFDQKFYCGIHNPSGSTSLGNVCYSCQINTITEKDTLCSTCTEFRISGKIPEKKKKEIQVKNFLQENKINAYLYDQRIPTGTSLYRPDQVIETKWGNIVLEIDEHQHRRKNYTCECEIVRMKHIYIDLQGEPLLYIRYNPDRYTPSYGKEFSESKRRELLLKIIQKYLVKPPDNLCTVIYLFYDGFSELSLDQDELDVDCLFSGLGFVPSPIIIRQDDGEETYHSSEEIARDYARMKLKNFC